MIEIARTTPLLRVADISRSMSWYVEHLGFEAHPFFEEPYVFAILEREGLPYLMLSRVEGFQRDRRPGDWEVYVTLRGGHIREAHAALSQKGVVIQALQRMSYGDCEFLIQDPDGNVLILSELLNDPSGIPDFVEEESSS